MQFTLESNPGINVIQAYRRGELRVRGRTLTRSVLLTATELVDDWPVATLDALNRTHMKALLRFEPEVVILGTGQALRFPPADVQAVLLERGIGMEFMDTGAACRTFNILVHEERNVAAAMIID